MKIKERLEEIKRNFEVMTSEEKDWLIEQVERVEDNDQAIVDLNKHVEELEDENVDLEEQNKRYREVLSIISANLPLDSREYYVSIARKSLESKVKYIRNGQVAEEQGSVVTKWTRSPLDKEEIIGGIKMKVGDLNMHCGECDIIDFCNDYEDTPPCAQPRFKNITVNEYLKAAVNTDMTYAKTKDEMVDKIYEALEEESK